MLFLDTETFSETPITAGTARYTDAAEVMLATFAVGDSLEIGVWDRTKDEPMPSELRRALSDKSMPVVMHQSAFDRSVLRKNKIVDIPPSRTIDTMVMALSHGLPGGLDKLCTIFGISEDLAKQKGGRQLIHFFCKPNRGKRNTWRTHPARWDEFVDYAQHDITSMRAIYHKLPKWNYPGLNFPTVPSPEHRIWCLDQRINERGFAVDMELAEAAVDTALEEKHYLNARTLEATNGEVPAATQRDLLLKHIVESYGIALPDMKADTLQRRIEDENLPVELRQLLDLRLQSSRNSASKYRKVIDCTSADGRLRYTLQFCGAQTSGRWAGRVIQPQNFMRPTMKPWEIEAAINEIKSGAASLLYDNLPEVLGNCVRGIIVAAPGKKLVAADLKSIEGRGLAYLANDEAVVQFYRDYDAGLINYDSYMLAYALCFGVDPATVLKPQRQIGKPIELAFGYGGGVAAFLTFAMVYHLDLDALSETIWTIGDPAHLNECEGKWEWAKSHGFHAGMGKRKYAAFEYVKQRWRNARPATVQFWADMADGFKMAVLYANETFNAGPLKFRRDGQWLRMRLPSGRCLVFLQPRIAEDGGLSYLGLDRYTRKLGRVQTHGGKLAGIATQAFASDVLRDSMEPLEDDGFEIVLTVHDEVITETTPDRTLAELCAHFTRPKPWAPGLPLAADGFETLRYHKAE